jgi:hypothetical protein
MVWAAGFVGVRAKGFHRPAGPMRAGLHVAIEATKPAA